MHVTWNHTGEYCETCQWDNNTILIVIKMIIVTWNYTKEYCETSQSDIIVYTDNNKNDNIVHACVWKITLRNTVEHWSQIIVDYW